MRVSIITVCLNSEKYLSDCIESVRNQSYSDIEYIVIDGGSTDKTVEIINRNLDAISKYKCEPDRGMYDAINKGIRMATGDIIGVLNSDDIFASADSIGNIVDCFQIYGTDSVYGDLVYVSPENTEYITRFWKGKGFRRYRFNLGWMPAHPTFYIRRDLIQQHGLYENHFYTAADYEFMARYLYQYRCSATYMEEIIVKMRCGGLSNGSLKRRLRANRRDYLAMKKNHILFPFLVSILKPISKIHQYKKTQLTKAKMAITGKPEVTYVNANSANFSHVESVQ